MHWIDWLIVTLPVLTVVYIALKAQKYVKSVSDFLAAGRVAGRYVVAVAGAEAGMGLISLVAMFEAFYNSGYAYNFWNQLYIPINMVILLTGYCIYRYRESRAMTMGQFFEMRYSRSFRIFAAVLQSVSGVINYAIFPAVGARFIIYYCDLPLQVEFLGMVFPTFGIVMAIFLSIAVLIVSLGGQITIMVTDCIQGILSYPLYAIIFVVILMNYSWTHDIAPTLMDRPPGRSMLNPFDISELRDFNLFYIFVGMLSNVFNRMAWSGAQGYNAAALNAHEQKMGAVLGTWRAGFSHMMIVILTMAAFTFLNNARFQDKADACRQGLATKVVADIKHTEGLEGVKQEVAESFSSDRQTDTGGARDISAHDRVKEIVEGRSKAAGQTFSAIYGQMRVPVALRHILPVGATGIFCALCVFLLISTDTTYMHSWGSIIVQDIVLPLRGKPLTPHAQLRLLRIVIALVAVFAFLFSFFFAQVDFILMFFAITGAIWLGGAGPCIVGGLYWKRGTTAGAFSSLISGSMIAVTGIITQKIWVPSIYPWLARTGRLETFTRIIEGLSRPLEPYIKWRVSPDKFPINSQEIYLSALIVGVLLYVIISLLTSREQCNMDRLLHRGKYRRAGDPEVKKEKLTFRTGFRKLLGIDSQYTRGDKILAWSVFIWSFGWGFCKFLVFVGWNMVSPWPEDWWAKWYLIGGIGISGVIAIISTVWFTIGGTWDLRRLFRRLKEKQVNVLDDGRVIGHVSADDVTLVEEVDHIVLEEAHREEEILAEELKDEHDEEDLRNLEKARRKPPDTES